MGQTGLFVGGTARIALGTRLDKITTQKVYCWWRSARAKIARDANILLTGGGQAINSQSNSMEYDKHCYNF